MILKDDNIAMKVNILFALKEGPWGGGNQFLKALRNEFIKMNVYEDKADKADAILFNSHHFLKEALEIKLKHPNILFFHRLDGPIQIVRGIDDGLDDKVFRINELISDGTIFQSNWIKEKSIELGLQKQHNNITIINAPEKTIFNNSNSVLSFQGKVKIIATSWSGNIRKGFDVYKWLDENLDFSKYEMTFIGNSPIEFKNIICKEPLNSINLAQELKKHYIYITASKHEPCSNALIEAMHCGLPALAFNNGGNPEIVRQGGELFNRNEEIASKLEQIVSNYDKYKSLINLPDISIVAKQYYVFMFSIFQKFQSQKYKIKQVEKKQYEILQKEVINAGLKVSSSMIRHDKKLNQIFSKLFNR